MSLDPLFTPIQFGAIAAPNRVVMAPLTRGRADAAGVPLPHMATYYRQRASAGLIISEATGISREGLGWPYAPGIWNEAQVEGWKPVVEAVHAAGGRIVLQLWHMGRVVHPDFNDGAAPVSASATLAPGDAHTFTGKQPYVTARALAADEIARVIDDYAHAAANARAAGFDGVQLHAANGYLIDQFLRDSSNLRDDDWGGSAVNRVRLLDHVLGALVAEWGANRVGVRFSPNGDTQGVNDSDPVTLFAEVGRVVAAHDLAFVELRQPGPDGSFGATDVPPQDGVIREAYRGPLVLNSDYTGERAAADVASGRADAISFGRPFISNPDLVGRLRQGAPLAPNKGVPQTWYFPGTVGYTDYPALDEAEVAA